MVGAYTMVVNWDRLLSVLRPAFPAMGIYGGDKGGDLPALMKCLRKDELIEKYARKIFEIDCAHEAKARPLRDQLYELDKAHRKAEAQVREDIAREFTEA